MAWPWVFALYLGTCLASLLDDEVGGVTLDHSFELDRSCPGTTTKYAR
jgi:hypothetical protein